MMKLLVICLALVLFASMGCGNRPQNDEEPATTQRDAIEYVNKISDTDPVDGSKIEDFEATKKYAYVYNRIEYRFNSKKNYEAFKKDPEKYLSQ